MILNPKSKKTLTIRIKITTNMIKKGEKIDSKLKEISKRDKHDRAKRCLREALPPRFLMRICAKRLYPGFRRKFALHRARVERDRARGAREIWSIFRKRGKGRSIVMI